MQHNGRSMQSLLTQACVSSCWPSTRNISTHILVYRSALGVYACMTMGINAWCYSKVHSLSRRVALKAVSVRCCSSLHGQSPISACSYTMNPSIVIPWLQINVNCVLSAVIRQVCVATVLVPTGFWASVPLDKASLADRTLACLLVGVPFVFLA